MVQPRVKIGGTDTFNILASTFDHSVIVRVSWWEATVTILLRVTTITLKKSFRLDSECKRLTLMLCSFCVSSQK